MRLSALCYSQQEDNRTRQINQKRRITETGQAFEPSSTVVHPCTTVEGEFCACTKHRCCREPLPSLAALVEQPQLFCGEM